MTIQVNKLKKEPEVAPDPEPKEKSPKKKSEKKTSKKEPASAGNWKLSQRQRTIAGAFLMLLALYLLLAQISYIFTWDSDFDQIDSVSAGQILSGQTPIKNLTGAFGALLAHLLVYKGFGISSVTLTLLLFLLGVRISSRSVSLPYFRIFRWSFYFLVWTSIVLGLTTMPASGNWSVLGGSFGRFTADYLANVMGVPGEIFVLAFVLFTFTTITWNIPYIWIKPWWERHKAAREEAAEAKRLASERLREQPDPDLYNTTQYAVDEEETDFAITLKTKHGDEVPSNKRKNSKTTIEPEFEVVDSAAATTTETDSMELVVENKPVEQPVADTPLELTIEQPSGHSADSLPVDQPDSHNIPNQGEHFGLDVPYDPTLDLPEFHNPELDLLQNYGSDTVTVQKDELEANKNRIVETLSHYQISISKIKATIGPTVTLYEIVPAPGVRISKIKNLEDDIALSLSALGIRIIAPIPGKGTIGIEVPNQNPEIVSMKSMLASDKFAQSKFELPIAIGKTISNEPYVADLAKMPHLLMAGATGQGKSVGLNAIIASLLYKKHPSQLKFVMVDPKKVELTLFSKIERHYLAKLPDSEEAIITDTRKVVRTLNSLSVEMDNRYELLKDAQVRTIKEYNTKFIARKLNPLHGHRYLPYIVLVVDEFADLIMTAGREIEMPIARLAQLARAIGIHLIIATQRPSVNIITGTIKANFPARIAFRVSSKIDSRTILDTSGAEQLIGRGDMLLSAGSDLLRLQCAFIDTPEIEMMTDYIGSQRGYPDAFHLPPVADETQSDDAPDVDPSERDDLFEEAARVIVAAQQGSTSLIQRKLKLGYNRAGRIVDQLEAAGIVGPFEGSKAREVKVPNEEALEQYLKQLNRESNG